MFEMNASKDSIKFDKIVISFYLGIKRHKKRNIRLSAAQWIERTPAVKEISGSLLFGGLICIHCRTFVTYFYKILCVALPQFPV